MAPARNCWHLHQLVKRENRAPAWRRLRFRHEAAARNLSDAFPAQNDLIEYADLSSGSKPLENAQRESEAALSGRTLPEWAVFSAPLLCGDRRHQRLDANDVHYPREIIGIS
jgi:hypothetical protein